VHPLVDAISDIESQLVHGVDGEFPGVVLFETTRFVGAEPDGMVSDLVEEDGSRHRAFGFGRFEEF